MAALHTTILGALCTAVDHLTGPRHLGLLLCLPLIAQFTLRGAHVCDLQNVCPTVAANYNVTIRLVVLHAQHARAGACSIASLDKVDMEQPRYLCCPADGSTDKDEATLMVQLARIHKIATAWRDAAPQELPPTGDAVYMAENLPGTHWLPFTSQVKCVLQCNALPGLRLPRQLVSMPDCPWTMLCALLVELPINVYQARAGHMALSLAVNL